MRKTDRSLFLDCRGTIKVAQSARPIPGWQTDPDRSKLKAPRFQATPLFLVHTNLSDDAHKSLPVHTSEQSSGPSVMRRITGHVFSVAAFFGAVWMLLGVLLRLTGWRDRFDGLSVVYYTTPWLVITAGFALLAIRARLRRRSRGAAAYGILTISAGIVWLTTSWYFTRPASATADFRIVLWNVRNAPEHLEAMAKRIREFSPDIVALAEAGNYRSNIDEWRAAFPDYTVERLPQQMLVMSRTSVQRGKRGVLHPGSFFGISTTEVGGRRVTVIQADLDARPLISRRKPLEALTKYARERAGQPLIVLGDFNTPRESYHLDQIRGMLTHAFEARGSGLADTWPIPLPVLSLDQVWVSPELKVVSCRQGWTFRSDHRPVFVELRFR